jgi:hypothetical protein
VHITSKIAAVVKTLNFLANNDRTFDGCSNGITPFCTPCWLAKAVNSDMADKQYFQESMLKSPADVNKFATGAKFDPPQTLHGLTRIFTNYIHLLKVLFGNLCYHLPWVLWLSDGLDLHERSLESHLILSLMTNLLCVCVCVCVCPGLRLRGFKM